VGNLKASDASVTFYDFRLFTGMIPHCGRTVHNSIALLALLVLTPACMQAGVTPQMMQYAPRNGSVYVYQVESSISQTLGEMVDFRARTAASTAMNIKILPPAAAQTVYLEYSYRPGKISLSGLSMAGIPDTSYTTSMPMLPGIREILSPAGKVLQRNAITNNSAKGPSRSEQLIQSLAQGARFFLLEFPASQLKPDVEWQINRSDTIVTSTAEGSSDIIISTILNCRVNRVYPPDSNGILVAEITCTANNLGFGGTIHQGDITMKVEGEGSARGLYLIEFPSGLPRRASLNMEYDLRMAATGQESALIPITMNMDTSFNMLSAEHNTSASVQEPKGNVPARKKK
jgi:hypothetical protein